MEAPIHPGLPLLGSILDLQRDALETFTRASRLGDVVLVVAHHPQRRADLHQATRGADVSGTPGFGGRFHL